MLSARTRSGLDETLHDGAIAVSSPDGRLLASSGDIDRPFFIRSSAKPFQGFVVQESGAGLPPVRLAAACSSHRGHPVQIAMAEAILVEAGLDESALQCPPAWPINDNAHDRLIREGAREPRRIWHNCSGKHAGFLAASVAAGWSVEQYLSPEHPIHVRVAEVISELGAFDVTPVGVDGCGAPVMRTTTRAMSRMFAVLGSDARFGEVFTAMHRYPALVGGNGEGDTSIAVALDAVAKGGALGCIGVSMKEGVGLAVKSWDGLNQMADVAAVAALDQLGLLTDRARDELRLTASPPQFGGGKVVGQVEPRVGLEFE